MKQSLCILALFCLLPDGNAVLAQQRTTRQKTDTNRTRTTRSDSSRTDSTGRINGTMQDTGFPDSTIRSPR